MEVTKKEAIEANKLYKALTANQKLKAQIKAIRSDLRKKNTILRKDNTQLRAQLSNTHEQFMSMRHLCDLMKCKFQESHATLHRYREYTIKRRRARVDQIIKEQLINENKAFNIVDNEIPLW